MIFVWIFVWLLLIAASIAVPGFMLWQLGKRAAVVFKVATSCLQKLANTAAEVELAAPAQLRKPGPGRGLEAINEACEAHFAVKFQRELRRQKRLRKAYLRWASYGLVRKR